MPPSVSSCRYGDQQGKGREGEGMSTNKTMVYWGRPVVKGMAMSEKRLCRPRLCRVMSIGMQAVALLLLAAGVTFSQTDRGTIRGTVLDTTGAVIPGASITVTNAATGVSVDTISTAAGTYNVPALSSGVYNVQVQLQGFKTLLRPNVAVSAGNITGLDLTIEVGEIGETL